MYNELNYQEEQEYNKYQELINTKEILTKEEYEFCVQWDSSSLFVDINDGRYLNINVCSDYDNEMAFIQDFNFEL